MLTNFNRFGQEQKVIGLLDDTTILYIHNYIGHAPPNDGGGGARGALHDCVLPVLIPIQFHVHGPVPDNADVVPAEQSPPPGAVAVGVPSAGPHCP
jgi:hypothetical protein